MVTNPRIGTQLTDLPGHSRGLHVKRVGEILHCPSSRKCNEVEGACSELRRRQFAGHLGGGCRGDAEKGFAIVVRSVVADPILEAVLGTGLGVAPAAMGLRLAEGHTVVAIVQGCTDAAPHVRVEVPGRP